MRYRFYRGAGARSALIVFSLLISLSAHGQKIRMGLKVIPSIAWLKPGSELIASDRSRMGFGYGLVADLYFTENYAFSTGAEVNYKGGSLRMDPEPAPSRKFDLQYLEIPLTLKMRTNQIGPLSYFGQVGLSGGLKLKSSQDINPVALALVIAGGVEMPFSGKTAFFGSLYFNNGFTDIIPGSESAISNYLGINIGVLF